MTDPSYRGQILVFTTPLIGNYGVPNNKTPINSQDVGVYLESQNIQCAAVIVNDVAERCNCGDAKPQVVRLLDRLVVEATEVSTARHLGTGHFAERVDKSG